MKPSVNNPVTPHLNAPLINTIGVTCENRGSQVVDTRLRPHCGCWNCGFEWEQSSRGQGGDP